VEAVEYTSCPYLYTFDGNDYVLENDIISVARTKTNEYTDYLFINNPISETDGKIRMKIVEPSGEFSRLDLLGVFIRPRGIPSLSILKISMASGRSGGQAVGMDSKTLPGEILPGKLS